MINYIKYFKNTTGGLENFSEDLLSKLQLLGIDLIIYKPLSSNRFLNYFIFYFRVLFNNKNVTIVHHGNFFDLFFTWFLSFINKRIILICHVGKNWRHIKIKYLNFVTNLLIKPKNIKLLVIAEAQKKFLKKKSIKIPTIINEKFFSTKNKHSSSKHLLFIGRVSEDKGVFNLLLAYNKLIKKIKLPKLLIVGPFDNSNYQKKCEDFCSKNDLDSSVKFIGPVYDIKKKIKLIDESFFGIYPSFYDAFPLTLLEFYSRKKILLCSNISESKHFVTNDELLINPYLVDDIVEKLKNTIALSKKEYDKNVTPMFEKTKEYDGSILALKIQKIIYDKI